MNVAGWIFLMISWLVIIFLLIFSFRIVLQRQNESKENI